MDKQRRKELQEQYKKIKIQMGVIQIKNLRNGRIYIAAYPNLKNKWPSLRAQLDTGRFVNAELQADWNALGPDAFAYEVLEEKAVDDDVRDRDWELKQMEKHWHEKLQPYGATGYNHPLR